MRRTVNKAYRVEADAPVDPYVLLWLAAQGGNEEIEMRDGALLVESPPRDSEMFGVKWVEA